MSKPNDRAREDFLAAHLARVEACHARISESGGQEPIVFLLDPRDETAADIVHELADVIDAQSSAPEVPNTESLDTEALGDVPEGIVFGMEVDAAVDRLIGVCVNCVRFIEHTSNIKRQIDKRGQLMMFLMISFGTIDCKLQPKRSD